MYKRILTPYNILVLVLLLGLVFVIVGCSGSTSIATDAPKGDPNSVVSNVAQASSDVTQPTASQPPKDISPQMVKIGDILNEPDVYKGQEVIVKGKILSECGSGCWFTLNDSSGTIYIDLAPSNLVIPQKRGATATVHARVVRERGDTYLIGTEVEF